MRATGTYVTVTTAGEAVQAFVPAPLPPRPALKLTAHDHGLIEQASRALGRLDGLATLLPDVSLFIYAYVRKEALMSSQIEGTQSSFADLLLHENGEVPGVPLEDVREVSDYVAALDHGVTRLRGGFPLSCRLLREIHAILLRGGRGANKAPGEFRRSQVWLGGTRPTTARFVPPPAARVAECMSALEKFLHGQPEATPTLVKAALAHVQFETIHPFLDGNGRLGRLLVTLLLCAEGAITEPLLYLSLFFKSRRADYYAQLQRVRTHGDWEGWLRFFLRGVIETSNEAVDTARRILALFARDQKRLGGLGRAAGNALRVHGHLQRHPMTSVGSAAAALGLSYPTVASVLAVMKRARLVKELTGYRRNRVFSYAPYVAILSEGTEPL